MPAQLISTRLLHQRLGQGPRCSLFQVAYFWAVKPQLEVEDNDPESQPLQRIHIRAIHPTCIFSIINN